MPKFKNTTTLVEDNASRLTEAGDAYTHSFEKYSYREDDDLPFDPDPFPEDEEESPPPPPKEVPKPLKKFLIKFVWTYREGERNWQELALNVTAKSVKQACFKAHEKLRQKSNVYYKITDALESNDLKPIIA